MATYASDPSPTRLPQGTIQTVMYESEHPAIQPEKRIKGFSRNTNCATPQKREATSQALQPTVRGWRSLTGSCTAPPAESKARTQHLTQEGDFLSRTTNLQPLSSGSPWSSSISDLLTAEDSRGQAVSSPMEGRSHTGIHHGDRIRAKPARQTQRSRGL